MASRRSARTSEEPSPCASEVEIAANRALDLFHRERGCLSGTHSCDSFRDDSVPGCACLVATEQTINRFGKLEKLFGGKLSGLGRQLLHAIADLCGHETSLATLRFHRHAVAGGRGNMPPGSQGASSR